MPSIGLKHHDAQLTAGVRERVPMDQLSDFFGRAFQETSAALGSQGVHPIGPPFSKYYGRPGKTVDVEAGFPVGVEVAPVGGVVAGSLPAGDVVEAVHIGPYDTLQKTYSAIERFCDETGIVPASTMWESYETDPAAQPDPQLWRTRICWPIRRRT